MTRQTVLPFGSAQDVSEALQPAVDHLRRAGLLAYPTETVYGFGGGLGADAVDALVRLKERDTQKGFVVLAANRAMLSGLRLRWTRAAETMASAFWPGPLTLVLESDRQDLPDALFGRSGGIAVRWTSLPSAASLIEAFGAPITSTSANPPGAAPATGAREIVREWNDAIDQRILLVLDAGILPPSPPSTVVDCATSDRPRLVRAGAIATEDLEQVVGPFATGTPAP